MLPAMCSIQTEQIELLLCSLLTVLHLQSLNDVYDYTNLYVPFLNNQVESLTESAGSAGSLKLQREPSSDDCSADLCVTTHKEEIR